MTESRVFNLPEGINAAVVGKEVENFLRGNKNLFTEGVETPDGFFVQAKEHDGATWKKISGMTKAIQVQIVEINGSITVNIGNGEWSDKIGAGVVGAVLFAPLAITAVIGAVNQKRLPAEIFAHIEKFIMNDGKTIVVNSLGTNVVKDDKVVCPNCNSVNDKNQKFCKECGSLLGATCPECGADVNSNAKFCPECGSPMKVPDKTCPECGQVIPGSTKFCGECGTKIE